jgi:ABC-2 type transport system ATP-binding protein
VVYLDEPTIGLDVAVKVRIRKFIKQMNARYGTTVILTTHDMQDIEEICQRIIIIDDGNVIYDGSIDRIKSQFGDKRVIHFELEDASHFALPGRLVHDAEILPKEEEDPHKVSITFSSKDITGAEVISIIMNHYPVVDLTIADPKIETIVEEIYGKGMKKEVRHEEVF